jgi:flagellar biosynthesis protein FlhA
VAPDGAVEPSLIKLFADEVAKGIDELENLGLPPVIITSNRVRLTLSRIARRMRPQAIVIAMGELPPTTKLSFQRVLCSAASN